MGVFSELGHTQGVFRIIAAQLIAKFPVGMLSIAIMLHMEYLYGNYTSAGVVLAAASIGQGISGPLTSRWMGVWGMRPVLILTTIVCATAMATIALVHLPIAVVMGISFIMGLANPPVTPAVRTIYPKLVPGRLLSPLFSLDASMQEIIWVIGPVLAVFISTSAGTEWGLLVAVVVMLAGGAWFILLPVVSQVRIPRARRRLGAVLTRPTVLISTLIGFLFVASFTAVELAIVSIYGHDGFEAGIVLALFALGSLVGGVTIGRRELSPWSMFFRSLIVLAGTFLTIFSFEMWWLGLVLFLGGLGTAPMLAALFTMVSATVKFSETAEAFGWIGTGNLIGAALGSAVAGIAIDEMGPSGGIIISVIVLVLTVVASMISVRWVPDLRGVEATPIPDTEPIVLPEKPLS